MERDIFNNNIKKEERSRVIGAFVVFGIIMFSGAAALGYVAYVGTGLILWERIVLAVCSLICVILGILYPAVGVKLIKTYPKHKKMAHMFIKEECFTE